MEKYPKKCIFSLEFFFNCPHKSFENNQILFKWVKNGLISPQYHENNKKTPKVWTESKMKPIYHQKLPIWYYLNLGQNFTFFTYFWQIMASQVIKNALITPKMVFFQSLRLFSIGKTQQATLIYCWIQNIWHDAEKVGNPEKIQNFVKKKVTATKMS